MGNNTLLNSSSLDMIQTFEWIRKRKNTKKAKYKELIRNYMNEQGTNDPLICLPDGDYGHEKAAQILSTFLFAPDLYEFQYSDSALFNELNLFIEAVYEVKEESNEPNSK